MKMNLSILLASFLAVTSCGEEALRLPDIYKDTEEEPVNPPTETEFTVMAKAVTKSSFDEPLDWTPYKALTVNCLDGFNPKGDPETDKYGGWKVNSGMPGTGFFRTAFIAGRWWLLTPEGNPYILKCLNRFSYGNSDRTVRERDAKFGSVDGWYTSELAFLKETGFNSVGAWSQTSYINSQKEDSKKIPYIVIYQPSSSWNRYLKEQGKETEAFNDKSVDDSWYGYPYSFVMCFTEGYEDYVESFLMDAARYKDDPYCIGYFVDNELPWTNHALDYCLGKWPVGHENHTVAQQWLDERKGKTGATLADVTDEDRLAFTGYCFGQYLGKIKSILRKYDPNHLYFGPRMAHWRNELANDYVFKAAGEHLDAWSFNHYRFWEPDTDVINHYTEVSGIPGMITEFYVKGDDTDLYYRSGHSGLTNMSGAGWLVHTQEERGLFFENFTMKLLQCPGCIGWNYFMYIDNDPEDPNATSGETDGNKGIVTCEFERYSPLIKRMKELQNNVFNLVKYYQKKIR